MKTVLFIDNLEVFANHGLFEEENKLGQKFIFSIECELDYKKALFSDEMTDSISYADIADVVVGTATSNTYNLLERLAGEILKNIFEKFPQIKNNFIVEFLEAICEPYLKIFRKIIPPFGMLDISPIAALVVLSVIENLIIMLLFKLS